MKAIFHLIFNEYRALLTIGLSLVAFLNSSGKAMFRYEMDQLDMDLGSFADGNIISFQECIEKASKYWTFGNTGTIPCDSLKWEEDKYEEVAENEDNTYFKMEGDYDVVINIPEIVPPYYMLIGLIIVVVSNYAYLIFCYFKRFGKEGTSLSFGSGKYIGFTILLEYRKGYRIMTTLLALVCFSYAIVAFVYLGQEGISLWLGLVSQLFIVFIEVPPLLNKSETFSDIGSAEMAKIEFKRGIIDLVAENNDSFYEKLAIAYASHLNGELKPLQDMAITNFEEIGKALNSLPKTEKEIIVEVEQEKEVVKQQPSNKVMPISE